jgi:hypothetical protein
MNQEEIEKRVLTLALEFYHHLHGDAKYDRLMALQQSNPDLAAEELTQFIQENEEALLYEAEVELVESVMED